MNSSFGVTLGKFIKAAGLSDNELAAIINISTNDMNRIVTGQRLPTSEIIQTIAGVLDLSQPETDFLCFLANKMPVDVSLFSSFKDYSTVMTALRNRNGFSYNSNPDATNTSPVYQVTNTGEICYYWMKSESSVRKMVGSVDHRRSGRTKLVLIYTVIDKFGPPKIMLPFEYQTLTDDSSILTQVSTVSEFSKKINKHVSTVLRDIALNDKLCKFGPGEYRMVGHDWVLLNTAIDREYRKTS